MVISKRKARKKLDIIFYDVHYEIKDLAFLYKKAYTSLMAVPSGRRFLRYAKKAKVEIETLYCNDALCGVYYTYGNLKAKKPIHKIDL